MKCRTPPSSHSTGTGVGGHGCPQLPSGQLLLQKSQRSRRGWSKDVSKAELQASLPRERKACLDSQILQKTGQGVWCCRPLPENGQAARKEAERDFPKQQPLPFLLLVPPTGQPTPPHPKRRPDKPGALPILIPVPLPPPGLRRDGL